MHACSGSLAACVFMMWVFARELVSPSVSQQGFHHAKFFSYSVSSLIHTWMMYPGNIHSALIPFLNSALLHIYTAAHIHTWEIPDITRLLLWASEQLLPPMRITLHHAKPFLTSYWHSNKCNKTAYRRLAWDWLCVLCMWQTGLCHWPYVVCQI